MELTKEHGPDSRHRAISAHLAVMFVLAANAFAADAPPAAKPLVGKVVAITDGDTIRVLDQDNVQHKVRLVEIDAPESGQAFGTKSKEALGAKVHEKSVRVEWKERDQYHRILGRMMLGDRDINKEMVADGWAWRYKRYSTSKELEAAEQSAREAKRGLWADPNPTPPWEWRKQQRESKGKK